MSFDWNEVGRDEAQAVISLIGRHTAWAIETAYRDGSCALGYINPEMIFDDFGTQGVYVAVNFTIVAAQNLFLWVEYEEHAITVDAPLASKDAAVAHALIALVVQEAEPIVMYRNLDDLFRRSFDGFKEGWHALLHFCTEEDIPESFFVHMAGSCAVMN